MHRFILIFLGFLIASCEANESLIEPYKLELETMSFDVVQKELVIDQDLPENVRSLISHWFDKKVKINGFDGNMIFTISKYKEEITFINDGKRVDISLSFKITLRKPLLSQTKLIEGEVSSYGTLTGNMSLNEFDTVIQNTQSNLILRLSRNLKNKI